VLLRQKDNFFMKHKYHENIMKELQYKSGLATTLRSILPAATAVCLFFRKDALDASKVRTFSEGWKYVALEAIKKHQPIPDHPVKATLHTANKNSISIITPDLKVS
jgi:hypothetical protein